MLRDGEPYIDITYYKIVSWDSNGIVASGKQGLCMSSKIIVNFQDRSITSIDSPMKLTDAATKSCEFFKLDHTDTYQFIVK